MLKSRPKNPEGTYLYKMAVWSETADDKIRIAERVVRSRAGYRGQKHIYRMAYEAGGSIWLEWRVRGR